MDISFSLPSILDGHTKGRGNTMRPSKYVCVQVCGVVCFIHLRRLHQNCRKKVVSHNQAGCSKRTQRSRRTIYMARRLTRYGSWVIVVHCTSDLITMSSTAYLSKQDVVTCYVFTMARADIFSSSGVLVSICCSCRTRPAQ